MKNGKRIFLIAAAAMLAVFTVGCSFSVSTANISDAIMTDSIDAEGKPGNTVTAYPSDAGTLYTSAILKNAPNNTQVRIVWIYSTTGETIYENVVDSGEISDRYIYSSISFDAPFPEGDYEAQYFIDDRKEADATVRFRVTNDAGASSQAYLEDVHMTSGFDDAGAPLDSISSVQTTGTWYVSAILRNTQADTMIRFVWYDTEGSVIDEYEFNPNGETDVYISGTLDLTTVAPEGEYWVELYIDDATEPAAQISFTAGEADSSAAADLGAFTAYSMEEAGFKVEYPSDWDIIELPDSYSAVFYPEDYVIEGKADVNSVIIVALKDYADGFSLADFQQAWIENTESSGLENYENVSSSLEQVNGREMGIYEYSYQSEGYDLYTMDFFVIEGSDVYVITFTATTDDVQTLYPYVEQIVLSFDLF